jgi:hypothetical protein
MSLFSWTPRRLFSFSLFLKNKRKNQINKRDQQTDDTGAAVAHQRWKVKHNFTSMWSMDLKWGAGLLDSLANQVHHSVLSAQCQHNWQIAAHSRLSAAAAGWSSRGDVSHQEKERDVTRSPFSPSTNWRTTVSRQENVGERTDGLRPKSQKGKQNKTKLTRHKTPQ